MIVRYPEAVLTTPAQPVSAFDGKLGELLERMWRAMYQARGIGIAAPQIGVGLQVFCIDLRSAEATDGVRYECINPKLLHSEGSVDFEEGCLSLPGLLEWVRRKKKVTLEYCDRHGQSHQLQADGLLAIAIQHEMDHLQGMLFIDRLSTIRRSLLRRKFKKLHGA